MGARRGPRFYKKIWLFRNLNNKKIMQNLGAKLEIAKIVPNTKLIRNIFSIGFLFDFLK